jgi:hypothetical protein
VIKKFLRLIFLLGCGYTSGQPCLQGGILELPLSLGQGIVPAHLSVLCELRSKRVVYLRLVIVHAAEGMVLVCGNKRAAGSSRMKTLWGKSSRATRHGSTSMTQRQNVSLRSESLLIPRDQRKSARCNEK